MRLRVTHIFGDSSVHSASLLGDYTIEVHMETHMETVCPPPPQPCGATKLPSVAQMRGKPCQGPMPAPLEWVECGWGACSRVSTGERSGCCCSAAGQAPGRPHTAVRPDEQRGRRHLRDVHAYAAGVGRWVRSRRKPLLARPGTTWLPAGWGRRCP